MQNYNSKFIPILSGLIVFLIFNLSDVVATDMESARYQIKYGNVNIGADNMTSPTSLNKLSSTIGQTAANKFSSAGYVVKAGFQYWHSIVPFTFSISDTNINLGTLIPDIPSSTAFTNLSVSFGSAGEYQVTAIEEGTLRTMTANDSIPDTACDGGSETCTETVAKTWTSNSVYGFGYNMSNEDVPTDFSDNDHYRPFPDRTADESPAVVMTNSNVTVDLNSKPKDIIHLSTMTFKANISALQPAGNYQTVISFVATPGY
jgi:hypothetical protein